MFQTKNIGATLQRTFTGSDFGTIYMSILDHVGFIFKTWNELKICDSTFDNGVSIADWYSYLEECDLYEK